MYASWWGGGDLIELFEVRFSLICIKRSGESLIFFLQNHKRFVIFIIVHVKYCNSASLNFH